MADQELLAFVDSLSQESWCAPEEKSTQTGVQRKLEFDDSGDKEKLGEFLRFPNDASPPRAAQNVLDDISVTMDRWFQRVLDGESQMRQTNCLHNAVVESLQRQQLDGLLTDWEVNELGYIAQLWIDLSRGISCYSAGCSVSKGILIRILLDLFAMKQIDSKIFVNICTYL